MSDKTFDPRTVETARIITDMRYISLLRGINVSGQKQIKMKELKSLYEKLGFQDIVTYIQSGNVIFSTKSSNNDDLRKIIEKAIEDKFGFHVPIEIRANKNLLNIIRNCPFGSVNREKDGTKILVTFLSAKPSKSAIAEIMTHVVAPEELIIKDREVYLYCPNGYGKSKLSNTFLEKKLGVGATTRNWKSVNRLYELAR